MIKNGLRLFMVVLLTYAFTAPSKAAVPGLSGRWNLNSDYDRTAKDSSGNNLDGIIAGATLEPGKFGGALRFEGANDSVHVPNNRLLEPDNLTVEAWVMSSGTPGTYRYIVSKGASADLAASYGLYTGSTGGLSFYISDGTNFPSSVSPDAGKEVWDGRWHHVAGTYDGSTVRLYVDGNEIGTGNPATAPLGYNLPDGNDLQVGGYAIYPDTHSFTGVIDEVRVWNQALSPLDIALHAAGNSVASADSSNSIR